MSEEYTILKTREDVIDKIFTELSIQREDDQAYLTRKDCVNLLNALTDLKRGKK